MNLRNIDIQDRVALIDGDILAYELGGLKKHPTGKGEEDLIPEINVGELLPFEFCWGSVNNRIAGIVEATGATDYMVYLSSEKIKTWRFETATILPYKGKRNKSEKPAHWWSIRENLTLHHPCTVVEFMEADDALSIRQWRDFKENQGDPENCGVVICTRDKDLNMVPGWHYGWGSGKQKETPMWFQSEIGGSRCFYKQMCTGDATDNIPGLFGVGARSAIITHLDKCDNEQEMFNLVAKAYVDRFGSYWKLFMKENGLLLKMQETEEDRWDDWKTLLPAFDDNIGGEYA